MDDELKKFIEATSADAKRHFDAVAERLESKIELVAEGVTTNSQQIQRVENRLEKVENRLENVEIRLDRLTSEMKADFSDVRSMIKFSHAELDRRIRSLEEGFADLQARVERLETSTH